MEVLILLCIITVALNIAIYPLCKITYRDEDAEMIAEGKLKVDGVKHRSLPATLGQDLKKRVWIDKNTNPWLIALSIIIIVILIAIILASKL